MTEQPAFDSFQTSYVVDQGRSVPQVARRQPASPVDRGEPLGTTTAECRALAELFQSLWRGRPAPAAAPLLQTFLGRSDPVFVCFRTGGKAVYATWARAGDQVAAIAAAFAEFRRRVAEGDRRSVDTVELCAAYDFQKVDLTDQAARQRHAANIHRGRRGLELSLRHDPAQRQLTAPTSAIATNRSVPRLLELFAAQHGLSQRQQVDGTIETRVFQTRQFLIKLDESPQAVSLFRGNRVVEPQEIDRSYVERLAQLLGDYLIQSVQKDGRMPYLYDPSRGTEDRSRNNSIRQCMASVALGRLARCRNDTSVAELALRNFRYNLQHFYREDGALGLIEEGARQLIGVEGD